MIFGFPDSWSSDSRIHDLRIPGFMIFGFPDSWSSDSLHAVSPWQRSLHICVCVCIYIHTHTYIHTQGHLAFVALYMIVGLPIYGFFLAEIATHMSHTLNERETFNKLHAQILEDEFGLMDYLGYLNETGMYLCVYACMYACMYVCVYSDFWIIWNLWMRLVCT